MEKIVLLFPGQGSQYVGMGRTLYDEYTIARLVFEEANDVLGFDLKKLCFEGSLEELCKTENVLPALLTASVAAFRVYMWEIGIVPQFSAGHSLGEYSALTCCGAMDFRDTLTVVRERSVLAQEVVDTGCGIMTVVNGVYKNIVDEECKKIANESQPVSVSCYNSPGQVVISGHKDAVMKVEDKLMELGAQITPLLMSAPFHCPLMQPAADKLQGELEKHSFNSFKWPVISNVTALPYENTDKIIKNLTLQMTKPVQWQATMDYLQENKITIAIEIGPQAVLSNLVKMNRKNIKTNAFGQKDDRDALLELFPIRSGIPVKEESEKNKGYAATVITKCLAMAVCTRNRNWNNDEYEKGVVKPYEKIEKIQEQLEKEDVQPTTEQMQEALEMLKSVFKTKKVPVNEQMKRFKQVLTNSKKSINEKSMLV